MIALEPETSNPTVDGLLAQESGLVVSKFGIDEAWSLGCSMRETAGAQNLPIAIEVSLVGEPVFFARMPGATEDNWDWISRKRRVVERFQHSSLYMRLLCEQSGVDFNARYRLPEGSWAAYGGSVPIFTDGKVLIGVASVSGLPDVDDHRFVMRSLITYGLG